MELTVGKNWLAYGYLDDESHEPTGLVIEVTVGKHNGEWMVEFPSGARIPWNDAVSLFPTREAAELAAADKLERLAAPILAEAARLRHEAAARVAAEGVVNV